MFPNLSLSLVLLRFFYQDHLFPFFIDYKYWQFSVLIVKADKMLLTSCFQLVSVSFTLSPKLKMSLFNVDWISMSQVATQPLFIFSWQGRHFYFMTYNVSILKSQWLMVKSSSLSHHEYHCDTNCVFLQRIQIHRQYNCLNERK